MEFSSSTAWWLLAGVLVAAELATGTFYLLMLALGAARGALAAHLGAGSAAQLALAAVAGVAATVAWHFKRSRRAAAAPSESNRDVNLDIGQTVHVPQWQGDGSARISYRGATWTVRLSQPATAQAGEHRIVAVRGNELLLTPVQP